MRNSSKNSRYIIYTDGATGDKNPRWGFVVYKDNKLEFMREGSTSGKSSADTNNVVEYCGLIYALNWVLANIDKKDCVVIRMDSKVVVEQVLGNWRTAKPHLRYLNMLATDPYKYCMEICDDISLVWIPRNENIADKHIKGEEVPQCLTKE